MAKFNFNILFFSFIAFVFINNLNALEYYHQTLYLPNDTVYDCYITDIFSKAGDNFIKIWPIKFLWGLDAITEAKKDGVADFDIDTVSNDTTWWVPNDYHIVNRDTSELKFIISDKVKVSICENGAVLKKITLKELQINPSYYKDIHMQGKTEDIYYSPYFITIENGKVTIIQETYIP
jgi:hypothetical protein